MAKGKIKEEQELYVTFNNGNRNITMRVLIELAEGYVLVDGMLLPKENVLKTEIRN